MSLQPLEDRIVVRSSEAESTTASGLVIPDTAQEKPQQGEVIAVGPGRRSDSGDLIPMDIAGIVANACLVGFGLAGGFRLLRTRQFGLRFLFAITTLAALCLFAFSYDNRKFVLLIAATIGLLLLSFVRQSVNAGQ